MDQIRNTMMQHEALFKEQVQALHKLYNIQKLAMHEIRRRIYAHAQVLTFSSERIVLTDDQVHGSILEGKPLRPIYATARACDEESLAPSLHPFLLFKESKGSGSLRMNVREKENFHTPQKKPIRNFDLEKLPEDFTGESEINVGSSNSEMVDLKSFLSLRTAKTTENSAIGANLSSVESESQNLKQICSETDLRLFTVTCQGFNQKDDQAPGGKDLENDVKKYDTNSWTSNNTAEKDRSKEVVRNYLSTIVSSDIFQDLSPSTNRHVERPSLLHHQSIGSDSRITTGPKSEQLNGCYSAGDYLSKNAVISYKDPSVLESLQWKPKDKDNFFVQNYLQLGTSSVLRNQNLQSSALISQTIIDGSNESFKDSSNKSAYLEEARGLGDNSCDKGKMSRGGGDIVESECQESPQFIQDGSKNSFCSNSVPENMSSLDDAVENDSNEEVTGKSAQQAESESVAAEILLSIAPCRKLVDYEFHCYKNGKSRGNNDNNTSRSEMRDAKGGGINDSIKWAKSASKRRTLRRPR